MSGVGGLGGPIAAAAGVGGTAAGGVGPAGICLPNTSIVLPMGPLLNLPMSDEGLQAILAAHSDLPQIAQDGSNLDQVNAAARLQTQQLQVLEEHAEYEQYLSYVFTHLKTVPGFVRSRIGLRLKSRISQRWTDMHPTVKEFIKQRALIAVADEVPTVRNVNGSIFTTIVQGEGSAEKWDGLVGFLLQCIQSGHPAYMDSGFQALSKISEDVVQIYTADDVPKSSLVQMLPPLLPYLTHTDMDVRRFTLTIFNAFLPYLPPPLEQALPAFLQQLYACATSTPADRKDVVQRICKAFVAVCEQRLEAFGGALDGVIRFMLTYTGDTDEVVALSACEFWSSYCDNVAEEESPLLHALVQYFPALVPRLLRAMRYGVMDMYDPSEERDDAAEPDRAEDIRPTHYKPTEHGADEDEDEEQEQTTWSLRKCAAAALDTLARVYGQALLDHLLPCLNAALNSRGETPAQDSELWLVRESGVLALGAIAQGCYEGMKPHLPQLIQFLLSLLRDPKPRVRSITCWTLSRYIRWVIHDAHELRIPRLGVAAQQQQASGGEQATMSGEDLFKLVIVELLKRMVDNNKKVQEAACSAFAVLEEEAAERLVPYVEAVVQSLMFAFQRYQHRNLLILYDAIGTLAESVPRGVLASDNCVKLLMPPLMNKWNELHDDDEKLLPLVECLTSCATALGMAFAPFALTVSRRALAVIERVLVEVQRHKNLQQLGREDEEDEPNQEFIVVLLDLLSGLCEGLQHNVEPLLSHAGDKLLSLLFECMKASDSDVRQSSFALLGDLAKFCVAYIKPHLDKFVPIAARNLNPRYGAVCNNASWAVGEIAIHAGGQHMGTHVDMLLSYVLPLVNSETLSRTLRENAAITLGRLGLVCAQQVSSHLEKFAAAWCGCLAKIRDPLEKQHAYQGLAYIVAINWQAMLPSLPQFMHALAAFEPTEALYKAFFQILHSYKSVLAHNWPVVLERCNERVRKHLTDLYKLDT